VKHNGAAIRAIRELRGVGLRQLAQLSGTSPTHLSRVEHEEREASDELRQGIGDALGVSVDAITREKK
jgi:transcriptional regulator with XRE-family HTH domain